MRISRPVAVPGKPRPLRIMVVLGVVSLGLLSACSGGSPSATHKNNSSTTRPATTTPAAAACTPSSVSASIDFTKFGSSVSSLAGAVLFSDTSSRPCSLHGVPQVQVLTADGQSMAIYQVAGPADIVTANLTPAAPTGTGAEAAASITFSDWNCETKTFSLSVRFPGWKTSVPAASNATSGTNSTTPCTVTSETGQSVYLGPVASVSS
jgi:hypothetical protein